MGANSRLGAYSNKYGTHKSAQSLNHNIGVAQKIILKSYTTERSTVASMIVITKIIFVHNDRYAKMSLINF